MPDASRCSHECDKRSKGGTVVNPTVIAHCCERRRVFFHSTNRCGGALPKIYYLSLSPISGVRGPFSARLFLGSLLYEGWSSR